MGACRTPLGMGSSPVKYSCETQNLSWLNFSGFALCSLLLAPCSLLLAPCSYLQSGYNCYNSSLASLWLLSQQSEDIQNLSHTRLRDLNLIWLYLWFQNWTGWCSSEKTWLSWSGWQYQHLIRFPVFGWVQSRSNHSNWTADISDVSGFCFVCASGHRGVFVSISISLALPNQYSKPPMLYAFSVKYFCLKYVGNSVIGRIIL